VDAIACVVRRAMACKLEPKLSYAYSRVNTVQLYTVHYTIHIFDILVFHWTDTPVFDLYYRCTARSTAVVRVLPSWAIIRQDTSDGGRCGDIMHGEGTTRSRQLAATIGRVLGGIRALGCRAFAVAFWMIDAQRFRSVTTCDTCPAFRGACYETGS
jgi:hypothetical protein